MNEIIKITKKLNKIALERRKKNIEYKKYDTKHIKFVNGAYDNDDYFPNRY